MSISSVLYKVARLDTIRQKSLNAGTKMGCDSCAELARKILGLPVLLYERIELMIVTDIQTNLLTEMEVQ